MIVVSDEKMRSMPKEVQKRAVKISASVLTSDPYVDGCQILPDVNTLTRNAASQAYEQAGIGPEDLDLVELHDCFATAELVHECQYNKPLARSLFVLLSNAQACILHSSVCLTVTRCIEQ